MPFDSVLAHLLYWKRRRPPGGRKIQGGRQSASPDAATRWITIVTSVGPTQFLQLQKEGVVLDEPEGCFNPLHPGRRYEQRSIQFWISLNSLTWQERELLELAGAGLSAWRGSHRRINVSHLLGYKSSENCQPRSQEGQSPLNGTRYFSAKMTIKGIF